MKEYITTLLSTKPSIGILASFSGAGVSLLALGKIITIVAGCLGAVVGLTIGIITLIIKIRELKNE